MDRFLKQLETALRVYILRGETVIKLLEQNNWEDAVNAFRDRKAAFLNYRTADSLHMDIESFYQSNLAKSIWTEIEHQDKKIYELLDKYKVNYEEQLIKIKKEKNRITKYRSTSQNNNTFVRSI